MTELKEIKLFNTTKGMTGLLQEIGSNDVAATVVLNNGLNLTGKVIKFENNILNFFSAEDRFHSKTFYIPLDSIQAVAIDN